jgi:glyoxylase-like metal-dependent hydrolase (beta-lactamase superfamily II)
MLGDIVQLADNLWIIIGDLPGDIPNVVVYRAGDRMYLMDSGAGRTMRASIIKATQDAGPAESFTLLNSHGHADHVGNNDLLQVIQAKEKHHYLSKAGLALLDPVPYFVGLFLRLSTYYDPTTAYQANRLRWRFVGMLRDILALFVGERRALTAFWSLFLRMKFRPFRPSRETIEFYESLPRQTLTIGGVEWTGWVLGQNDVWILEERAHTPDEMLFYLPEHQLLHTGDLTFPLFPTFPDTNGKETREMLYRCKAMASAGAVRLLTDGHLQQVTRGQDEVVAFLGTLLAEHDHFQTILREVLEEHDGLTVAEVYACVCQRHDDPVVQHYLSLEYPHLPMSLQQIIAVSLPQMGYEARGPNRKKRFYRSHVSGSRRSGATSAELS